MDCSLPESATLLNTLCQRIDVEGPLTFAEYMNAALYEPGQGYYRAGFTKFGREGDFVTAPELSPLFAQCVAESCRSVLSAIGGNILEVGAGSGRLAADLLKALAAVDCLPAQYYILELSAELKARQQATLKKSVPALADRVVWLSSWPAAPFDGVVIANEVLDAMPVHQFVYDGEFQERYVTHQRGELQWLVAPPKEATLTAQLKQYDLDLPVGYQSEVSLLIAPWIAGLSACLRQGVTLLFDYGYPRHEYYHPQRNCGTVMCHHRHHAHPDPLIHPGEQDITAFVDFTLVAKAASANALDVLGFTHQAGYLMNCGIASMAATQSGNDIAQFEMAQQLKQLMLPTQMGEAFKVMALGKGFAGTMVGFETMSQLGRL